MSQEVIVRFAAVCFSNLVSTVFEILYILINIASIAGGRLSVPCVAENAATYIATIQIILPFFNVASNPKADIKICIKLIYGEKEITGFITMTNE